MSGATYKRDLEVRGVAPQVQENFELKVSLAPEAALCQCKAILAKAPRYLDIREGTPEHKELVQRNLQRRPIAMAQAPMWFDQPYSDTERRLAFGGDE